MNRWFCQNKTKMLWSDDYIQDTVSKITVHKFFYRGLNKKPKPDVVG